MPDYSLNPAVDDYLSPRGFSYNVNPTAQDLAQMRIPRNRLPGYTPDYRLSTVLPTFGTQAASEITGLGDTFTGALNLPEFALKENFNLDSMFNMGFGDKGGGGVDPYDIGKGTRLGANVETLDLGLSGLRTLGTLWGAFQAQKMAKKQFKFQKQFAETNLANQIQDYNTRLEGRARARGIMQGDTPETTQGYIDQHQLPGYQSPDRRLDDRRYRR